MKVASAVVQSTTSRTSKASVRAVEPAFDGTNEMKAPSAGFLGFSMHALFGLYRRCKPFGHHPRDQRCDRLEFRPSSMTG